MDKLKRLPDSELEVMIIIWDGKGHVSTSDIMQQLGETKKVQMIQSYLSRLEEKGFVKCEKIGRLNHYTPLITIEAYREQETDNLVEKLYKNSPTKLFTTLLQSNSIKAEDIAEIKRILEGSNE